MCFERLNDCQEINANLSTMSQCKSTCKRKFKKDVLNLSMSSFMRQEKKCDKIDYLVHTQKYLESYQLLDNDVYNPDLESFELQGLVAPSAVLQRQSSQVNLKTHYNGLTLSQCPSPFSTPLRVRIQRSQSPCKLYTSVEKRMLCRLLSGVGMVSSCRKYSKTWT